ncbi:hypothetical protein [Streptococcus dentiloxodontae]
MTKKQLLLPLAVVAALALVLATQDAFSVNFGWPWFRWIVGLY